MGLGVLLDPTAAGRVDEVPADEQAAGHQVEVGPPQRAELSPAPALTWTLAVGPAGIEPATEGL